MIKFCYREIRKKRSLNQPQAEILTREGKGQNGAGAAWPTGTPGDFPVGPNDLRRLLGPR